jgi:hypothetical protein
MGGCVIHHGEYLTVPCCLTAEDHDRIIAGLEGNDKGE